MMAIVIISVYLLITSIGWFLHKSVFSPLFSFGAVWTLTFFMSAINSYDYYDIRTETYLIFMVGAFGFTLGAGISSQLELINTNITYKNISINKFLLNTTLLILLVGWFEYYRQISQLTSGEISFSFFQQTRYALVQASLSGEKLIGGIANFEVLSVIVFTICAAEFKNIEHGKIYLAASALIGMAYVTIGGAKGGALALLMTSFIIIYFNANSKKILRNGVSLFFFMVAFFSIGLYLVNFTYTEFSSQTELVSSILKAIRNYWVGGIFAFDEVALNPANFVSSQDPTRFFLETANSLGANIAVPPIHADYVDISPTESTNTYTIFYSYYLFGGYLAVFIMMAIYAFVMTILFRLSKNGDKRMLILYSGLLTGLIFSIVSERFFLALNATIKTLLFVWLIYYVSRIFPSRNRSALS